MTSQNEFCHRVRMQTQVKILYSFYVFLMKIMAINPKSHVYLDIACKLFQSTKVEEREYHNFLILVNQNILEYFYNHKFIN